MTISTPLPQVWLYSVHIAGCFVMVKWRVTLILTGWYCPSNWACDLLLHVFQALQYADQLKEQLSVAQSDVDMEGGTMDDPELLALLQTMLGLTITPIGRDALVNVLSFDLEPLLTLIEPSGVFLITWWMEITSYIYCLLIAVEKYSLLFLSSFNWNKGSG